MSTITLRWVERHLMVACDSNGHSVVIGQSPEDGEGWVGVKPSDLLLVAVAACAAWDVIEILHKQREPMQDLKILCSGDQSPEPPHAFTQIHVRYVVRGRVRPDKLERAIRLAEDKYCSVISTLRPGVPVRSEYEILSE
jgi:putative redox protein